MRRIGLVMIGLVLSWQSGITTDSALAAERRPNIVVIVADDLGYADVGFQGCHDVPTTHIDSIAANGVRCRSGYVSGPYCSPTRAGLLTGRYQQRFGHEFNPGSGKNGLPLSETTIADRLRKAGYRTGLVGKWHLGELPDYHPQNRGFDEFYGFLAGHHSYFNQDEAPIYRGTEQVKESAYLTDAFGREAVSFIDRNQEKPFFLYLAFNAVHTPLEADEERLSKFAQISDPRRRKYAAMLSAMDDAIGRVLTKLRETKLEENTLIVFFSDNGGPTMQGTTINGAINSPLRGSKRTTLEGGIRVPFAIQWKGHISAGSIYDHPVIQLDVLPTVLTAAGIPVQPDWKLDGVDLLPFLTGKNSTAPHAALYWRLGAQNAIRQGDWKLVQYDLNVDNHPTSGVTGKKLYNLANDIGEQHDLAADQPEKVKELEQLWAGWNQQLVEPLWASGAAVPKTTQK